HVLRQGMERSVRAMADAAVDMERCLPWAPELAKLIHDYAGGKRLALLTALLEHPAADLPALARSVQVMCAVCVHPKLLKWLLAQPGVDASARLYRDEDGQREEMGSLLFHSVEFFEDRADVLKVLYAAGARSVLMSHMPAAMRLDRTLCGYRDADTPAELVAAGIDLDQHIWSGEYPILRLCLRNYTDTQRELQLIAELMDMGASVHYWMDPETFQVEVLEQIFSAYWQENEFENEEGICLDEGRATGIVSVFNRLLDRGLEANIGVSFGASDVTERNPVEMYYEGSLIGAIACVLCSRGSRLRRLCLPLVEQLLAHGADPQAIGHLCRVDPNGRRCRKILVDSDELATGAPWSEPSSILSFLRQRNAEDFDEIDAAVIAAMTRKALAHTH
ncbi:hypothetical protein PO883_34365, partial [Massilia sp. DJPM01]|uniref:hypothetical protein n=1 Tax=Massilia sp. DJPM01 TaxID=3024404 RepID=UPI00259D7621